MGITLFFSAIAIALYFFVQAMSYECHFMTGESFYEFEKDHYSEDENGLLYLNKKAWWDKLIFSGYHFYVNSLQKKYVTSTAEEDAEKSKYKNRFGDKKTQELYDTVFKEKRNEMIVKAVQHDVRQKHPRKFSEIEAEQAIYQEEYVKALSKITNLQEIMDKRIAELYGNSDSEVIDFKKLKQFVETM